MKLQSNTNQFDMRTTTIYKGENEMKSKTILSPKFPIALALAVAFIASLLGGKMPVSASGAGEDNVAVARHFTIVYDAPQAGPIAAFVLMPESEVGLAGRSADGKWLALQNGWVQVDDLRTNVDLASLPVIQEKQAFTATTRHLSLVYETPSITSQVQVVLMPETEVSLAGRSADGEWLALGSGWVQRVDVRTQIDLADLPILNKVVGSE
jgi:hypothetical protein